MFRGNLIVLRLCMVLLTFPVQDNTSTQTSATPQTQQSEEIEVRIAALKSTVVAGQTLQLRIEIWNVGSQDLFICKNFDVYTPHFCYLTLTFQPPGVRSGSGLASDIGFPNPNADSFVNALVRSWISIPPGHFYGAVVDLNPGFYSALATPGHYRIRGTFGSGGLLTPAQFNVLPTYSKEVGELPGKSWAGKVETNVVEIHVVPKKQ